MAYKQKGFPMHSTSSVLKQKEDKETLQDLNITTSKEDKLASELDKSEKYDESKYKEYMSEGRKRRANTRAHGTYEEYLKDVEGGEGSLTRKEWLELNSENIKGA